MNIVQWIADLEQNNDLHLARLLIILESFQDSDGNPAIEGLTKLAKLDFLLRYPAMLQRALEAKEKSTRDVGLEAFEINNVESSMVRYRFGPWDHRYREFINILVAKGLAKVFIDGRTILISPTANGAAVARDISGNSIFSSYKNRSMILKRHFDMTATNLMRFIYATFPEIISLQSNKRILP